MSSNVKPISEARSAAARANGAKSKGPKTPEGKARSARNSVKHGLTAETLVLPYESAEDFEDLRASFLARFEPRDAAELALVEQMVSATWRQRRYWQLETNLLQIEMDQNRKWVAETWEELSEDGHCALAFKSLGNSAALDRLLRYDNSLRRQFERALTLLLKLRAEEAKTAKRTQAAPPEPPQVEIQPQQIGPSAAMPPDSPNTTERTQGGPRTHPRSAPIRHPDPPHPPGSSTALDADVK